MNNWVLTFLLLGYLHYMPAGFAHDYPSGIASNDRKEVWVFFTDKPEAGFDPYAYLSSAAIERRLSMGFPLFDSLDYPVCASYVLAIEAICGPVEVVSRWMNAVCVGATEGMLNELNRLPFVKEIREHTSYSLTAGLDDTMESELADVLTHSGLTLTQAQIETLSVQLSHMQGQYFIDQGINGRGIRIAVFDAGFPGVDTHPAFEHLRRENRIIATWDFHRNREDVYGYNAHGTTVLSLIGGKIGDVPMGLATASEFLLARTEIRREPLAEEKYWLAAVEWADRMGAHIINSSLGYFHHRYFREDMDGRTSLVAQAASMAARRGILVVNAAGNEGMRRNWRIIITPADADSVLTVGAITYPDLLRTPYSSVGPTADLRMKPNLTAMGNVLAATRRGLGKTQGTSFASPLVAGFAACVWQINPSWTNMDVFRAMEQSASLYPYFDYSHGYGVPQAGHFVPGKRNWPAPTFDIQYIENRIIVMLRHDPGKEQDNASNYLFYHIQDQNGVIKSYHVLEARQMDVLSLSDQDYPPGYKLFVHYKGFTATWFF